MMTKVTSVEAKANYTLALTFNDGLQGELCIKDRLFGVMFEPLKKEAFFLKYPLIRMAWYAGQMKQI